jgi:ribosomal protein S18 acetylase RimI-like enzyme
MLERSHRRNRHYTQRGVVRRCEAMNSLSWLDRYGMRIKIQTCSEEHIETLQKISYETYDETFRGMNTAETMKKYMAQSFNRDKLLSELRNHSSRFFLMHVNGLLVGYLKLNEAPAQTDKNDPEGMEIERIYIRGRHKGKGYGRALMKFALEKSAELQKRYAWLGVWEKNENAIAFYEKLGFERAGNHLFRMGDEIQSDYIMKKSLKNP